MGRPEDSRVKIPALVHFTRLAEFKICLPPLELVTIFENRVQEYCNLRKSCEDENHELVKYRDYLLPMLMTGQIKVK